MTTGIGVVATKGAVVGVVGGNVAVATAVGAIAGVSARTGAGLGVATVKGSTGGFFGRPAFPKKYQPAIAISTAIKTPPPMSSLRRSGSTVEPGILCGS